MELQEIIKQVNRLDIAEYSNIRVIPSQGYDFRESGYTSVVAEFEIVIERLGGKSDLYIPIVLLDTDEIKVVDDPDQDFGTMPDLDDTAVWRYLFFEVV